MILALCSWIGVLLCGRAPRLIPPYAHERIPEHMLRNSNLTINNIQSVHSTEATDDLVGPRPSWWWSGQSPTHGKSASLASNGKVLSLPLLNLETCTRQEVFDYFSNGWLLNEVLFSGLRGEQAFTEPPYHGLRHPMIFYYGHTACLFVNKLLVAGLLSVPVDDYFERIFEIGVDEMSWDDMSKNEMTWPNVKSVNDYRGEVFRLVADLIATHPGLADGHAPITEQHPLWALFMSMEHERIHLETSSVLMREMPLHLLQRPAAWPSYAPGVVAAGVQENVMLPVTGGPITLGKPASCPSYGWDNEYGVRKGAVDDFSISRFMVTNGEFLEFMKDNGYQEPRFWTEHGGKWRAYRNSLWPTFWVPAEANGLHDYRLRTIFDVVDLPLDWPVCVNFHEARAYLAWKSEKDGKSYRLPTEAEHAYLRRGESAATPTTVLDYVMAADSIDHQRQQLANANLAFGSEAPVHWSQPGPFGVHDIAGNLWDWCEDDFNAFDGFKTHALYDDFSTPCFDGEHAMILGGSFMSTGNEASVWSRFHFRPHFFQHAGFHVVAPTKDASGAVRIKQGSTSKYDSRSVLDQYLLFHFGDAASTLPSSISAIDVGGFPQRCAAKLIELAAKHDCSFTQVLDVGCAVGGATFELVRAYDKVFGVDISAQFIDTAEALRSGARIPYKVVMEGDIYDVATAQAPAQLRADHIQFRRADACSLPAEYEGFDAVLAGNLLCRLPSPKAFLSRMSGSRGLVKPGGMVMFASPFSWLEQFTPRISWLGGVEDADGRHWSADGLQEALGDEFELVYREDFPFMIREHRRKFEYVVSDLTVWLRKK